MAADTDGDGTVSDAERAAARTARVNDMMTRLDADGDGKLTVDELAASRFARRIDPTAADLDHDGIVTADELGKAMPTFQRRRHDGQRPDDNQADDTQPAAP